MEEKFAWSAKIKEMAPPGTSIVHRCEKNVANYFARAMCLLAPRAQQVLITFLPILTNTGN
jgi:hypothetical protein